MSGPSALAADAAGEGVWLVMAATGHLVHVRCSEPAEEGLLAITGPWRIGAGARGLAVDERSGVVWVDVAFDHAVARLDPTTGEMVSRRREPGPAMRLSATEARGRRIFHDATDTHLTPSGIVSCATCHPGGQEDGLPWFFHTRGVSPRLRRTPSCAGADGSVRPMHWDGEFQAGPPLVLHTVRELMGGDGLLVDADAVTAWMRTIHPVPPRPSRTLEAADLIEGARLFDQDPRTGPCGDCHAGEAGTDGRTWSLLQTEASPLLLDAVVTPGLRGVRRRAPFFHDGSAPSLQEVIRRHPLLPRRSELTDNEVHQLATWLQTW